MLNEKLSDNNTASVEYTVKRGESGHRGDLSQKSGKIFEVL